MQPHHPLALLRNHPLILGKLAVDQRKAVTVGGYHPNLAGPFGLEEDTIEDVTRLVVRNRERRLLDHFEQEAAVDVDQGSVLLLRQLWIFLRRHADNLEVR